MRTEFNVGAPDFKVGLGEFEANPKEKTRTAGEIRYSQFHFTRRQIRYAHALNGAGRA
jgi:hypothetical protein